MRSRRFMTTALAGIAGAIWSGTSRVTLRFDVRRGLSLRCWVFGHDDWIRRVPGRLYLECFDCGRETPGWTTSRTHCDERSSTRTQAISWPDRSGSEGVPSAVGQSRRPEEPANDQHEIPRAA